MKFLVLGAGRMGAAIAYDLARSPGVERIFVADASLERARVATGFAERPRPLPRLPRERPAAVEILRLDATDPAASRQALALADCAVSALPFRWNPSLAALAIETKTHFCDLGGNDEAARAILELDEAARRAGVRLIPDAGLAPGLSTVLAAAAIARLDEAESVRVRCGGVPLDPKGPLRYRLVFSVGGLLNEYLEPVRALRDGEVRTLEPLTEVEEIHFPKPFGRLEAFLTSGGLSTLPDTFAGRIRELDDKTIRWPGHAGLVRALVALGFASREPIEVEGRPVSPRAFLAALLERALSGEGEDAVLLRVTAEGTKGGSPREVVYETAIRDAPEEGMSAMARATAFPAASVARMAAFGEIRATGALRHEQAVPASRLLEDLEVRGIRIECRERAPGASV